MPAARRRDPLGRLVPIAALIAVLMPCRAAARDAQTASEITVKAAFLYNFVKFSEWPALRPGAAIVLCVVGDEAVAGLLVETVRGQTIGGHALEVSRPAVGDGWRPCHLVFLAGAEIRRAPGAVEAARTLPILTVSDGKGFALAGGMIELLVDDGRMRFAINVDAVDRSGLRLSSRLLGLAKIVRDPHAQ